MVCGSLWFLVWVLFGLRTVLSLACEHMVIKCVDIIHGIYTIPSFCHLVTKCVDGCHCVAPITHFVIRLQNALQWTHNLLPFQRILLPGNKLLCGSKIGAYI